jgi:WD40 repeat protein
MSGALVSRFNGHSKGVPSVVFSTGGTTAASISFDQTIQLWDSTTGNQLQVISVESQIYGSDSISFSPDEKCIITSFGCFEIGLDLGSTDNAVILHDMSQPAYYATEDGWFFSVATKQRICWIPHECRGCWASNKNTIVLGSHEGNVTILDLRYMNP